MRRSSILLLLTAAVLAAVFVAFRPVADAHVALRVVDPAKEKLVLRWKDANGQVLGNIGALEREVKARGERLLFAMNGGMYMEDQRPLGLYVEEGKQVRPLITREKGTGNFYMQPNGVFGIGTDGKAFVRTTRDQARYTDVHYATQSGPMLLVNGTINAALRQGSSNLNIRNGVGVRPNGQVVFGISTAPINFYDFAAWFKDQGCTNALYLDGAISAAYIPEAGLYQHGGVLGPLIAVVAPAR